MPGTPEPTSPDPVSEPQLAAFREDARAILALSGGLNALSMGKVRHLGRELGLDDAQVESVVRVLRAGPSPAESPQLVAFRREVETIFRKAKLGDGSLLNPRLAERIEAHGRDRYALDPARAAEALREVARDKGIKRISLEGAEAAVRQQAAAMHAAGALTPARRRAFGKFATSLGVRAARAAEILREETLTAVAHPNRLRAENSRFLWGLIGGAALVLLVSLLAINFVRKTGRAGASSATSKDSTADRRQPRAPSSPDPDDPIALAVAEARAALDGPADATILERLADPDEANRLGALKSLELRLPSRLRDDTQRTALARLLAALHAHDPAASIADEVRSLVAGRLRAITDPEAGSPEIFPKAFWALDLALTALRAPDLDPDRARTLAEAVLQSIGGDPSGAEALAQALRDSPETADARAGELRARFARFAYRALTDRAATQAAFGDMPLWRDALAGPASAVLPPDQRVRLDAEFLTIAVGSPAADFRAYLGLLRDVLNSGDPEAVTRVVEIYEKTANAALHEQIGDELAGRLGAKAPADPDALGDAYLRSLKPAGGRVEQFRKVADAALAAKLPDPAGPASSLAQLLTLARASALGCALAAGEPATARFDELLKPPPDARAASAPGGNPNPPAMPSNRPPGAPTFGGFRANPPFGQPTFGGGGAPSADQLVRQILARSPFDRMNAWRLIAQVGLPDDLPAYQARILARYVLWGAKTPNEQAITTSGLTAVVEPPPVRLAMADLLGEVVPLPHRFDLVDPPLLSRLLETITGRGLRPSRLHYRGDAERTLLEDVLGDLEPDFDALAERYRDLYRTQGLLLGLSDGDSLLTARPSQMIEVVANHLIARLEADRPRLSEPDRARLDRLPHEVLAADYAAGPDELARAVLLQRVWLQALALHVAARQPPLADQARALADAPPSDLDARDPLAQLRHGEAQALRLWSLLAKPQ